MTRDELKSLKQRFEDVFETAASRDDALLKLSLELSKLDYALAPDERQILIDLASTAKAAGMNALQDATMLYLTAGIPAPEATLEINTTVEQEGGTFSVDVKQLWGPRS